MSFLKSLWSFVKAHPVGSAVTFVLVVPLVFGSIALTVYRKAKAALPASVGDKLPTK